MTDKEKQEIFHNGWEYGVKLAIDVAKELKDSQRDKVLLRTNNLKPQQLEGFNYAMNLIQQELLKKINNKGE